MRVVGTAGHVDHGKSTLVRALTGINPDRLAEEKAREMTIDLGFAWFDLPDGQTVGIVDVPGHRDFIENMLAGVGGIDAVMLVIAADEGVMPQTREHLAILDLLNVTRGLVVLSKSDLVDDPEWLELVARDIGETLAGTALAGAEIVPVSARIGAGLPELVERLAALLEQMPPRADAGSARLPIDRVFTISGFGTVVTGTLLGGWLRVGDEVEIQPNGLRGRIRGLQRYKQPVEAAEPGSRVAVNITGIEKKALARGSVLSHPSQLQPSLLVDARVRYLKDAGRPLKHNAQVKFFSGAAESIAHVRLLDAEELPPGAEGWLQIRLENPLTLSQGDRFILRYPSPPQTIGGGLIVNAHPGRRWKRFQPDVIAALVTRLSGTPAERVAQAARQPEKRPALQKQLGYEARDFEAAVSEGLAEGLLVELPGGELLARASWEQMKRRMHDELDAFHRAEPLRPGMSREELRSRLGLKGAALNALLAMQDEIVVENDRVRLSGHQVRFSAAQAARIRALGEKMAAAPYTPPSFAEAAEMVGQDILYALIEIGDIVQVQDDVIFSRAAYDEMLRAALEMIDAEGSVSAAGLRDRFNTTRKYAIGLLEYLDAVGVTRRVGDARVRGHRSR
ncbi:MAG: selenocysteine-specific translation elongation factor [Chloroflexi bacterium]|nr:selenocysteine-specific translation elongation factor [Chloroflexota bacterium]MDL1884669.1 selenocysteine-specific translation elongation factor [Anaerolineae bacterium CFX8]